MVTPGTAALSCFAVTVPAMLPLVTCASSAGARSVQRATNTVAQRLKLNIDPPVWWKGLFRSDLADLFTTPQRLTHQEPAKVFRGNLEALQERFVAWELLQPLEQHLHGVHRVG